MQNQVNKKHTIRTSSSLQFTDWEKWQLQHIQNENHAYHQLLTAGEGRSIDHALHHDHNKTSIALCWYV